MRSPSPVVAAANALPACHLRWLALGAIALGCSTQGADHEASETATAELGTGTGTIAGTPLPVEWPLNGSPDCRNHVNGEPSLFTFKYDANTWIIRENKCLNFEANFIFVLFGRDKVLVQDTGSIPSDWTGAAGQAKFKQAFPLRDTVESLITDWLAAHPAKDGTPRTRESVELLVTHSHSHGDHVGGDYQFKGPDGQPFPHTRIAGLRPSDVAAFFGITSWPTKPATFDLGERKLEVMGIPGHEASHVAIYDHGAQLLLSGDSLYPGHLFVRDWTQYRASVSRLAAWMHETDSTGALVRPTVYVLGTHIEKKPAARQFYPYPSWIQNPERKLELFSSDLDYLAAQTEALGATSPHREIAFDEFAIDAQ